VNPPAKRVSARLSVLPAPELISLIGDPSGPYADSPEGWWTEYGGALDSRSGVVYFPPDSNPPPCRLPDCQRCADRQEGA
jgi:hypothetical protein